MNDKPRLIAHGNIRVMDQGISGMFMWLHWLTSVAPQNLYMKYLTHLDISLIRSSVILNHSNS